MLADHYAQRMAERIRKHVESIPSDVMEALESYDCASNARELQNFHRTFGHSYQGPGASSASQ